MLAIVAGITAYRLIGPYGDGPFGAGYRRVADPDGGPSLLLYDHVAPDDSVRGVVDGRSHRLSRFLIDTDRDGRQETIAVLEEGGLVRVERDLDDDGVVDRWEYRATDRSLVKVGLSLAADGVLDAWAHYDDAGQLALVEVSTARDGVVDRWERYEGGAMVRLEEDSDGNGVADRWSTFVGGVVTATGDVGPTPEP